MCSSRFSLESDTEKIGSPFPKAGEISKRVQSPNRYAAPLAASP